MIDGGSTDGSVDIIRRYAGRLAYWVSEPDRGQSDAINKGFARATGAYWNWLNADDVLRPGALRVLAGHLDRQPDVDVVFGNTMFVDRQGRDIFPSMAIPYDHRVTLYAGNFLPQPSALFRRRLIDRTGPLDATLHYCMDHELWLRAWSAGYRFAAIRDCVSGYRLHAASKGVRRPPRLAEEQLDLKRRYGIRLPNRAAETIVYGALNAVHRMKRRARMTAMYRRPVILPMRVRLWPVVRAGRL